MRLHTSRANRKLGAMPHIRKASRTGKGGGRRMAYEVRYRDPARRERSRTFARRVDAERFVATIETDVARGQHIDPLLLPDEQERIAVVLDEAYDSTKHSPPLQRT